MQKKLSRYEELDALLLKLHKAASEFIRETLEKPPAKREELQETIMPYARVSIGIAEFADANRLFLDEEVTDHILMTGLVIAEIQEFDPKKNNFSSKVNKIADKFYAEYGTALDMIAEYSGIDRLRKSLSTLNQPKTKSNYVQLMKETRGKYKSGS